MEAITPARLKLLRLIAAHPGIPRAKLLSLPSINETDVAYLTGLDLIREGELGTFRVTNFGQMVLKRSL